MTLRSRVRAKDLKYEKENSLIFYDLHVRLSICPD
jgi:hypothetical protein